ncbi:MAG: FAD-dependent oxidoreductase [Gemmataceae bacterium]
MRIAVIGGGIQGVGTALELARRGVRVDLFERGPALLGAASRQNEGKLHLGYVYANDPGFATADLMIQGALTFRPLLRRWLESDPLVNAVSRPFHYLVHRDSLLCPDLLADHYTCISQRIEERAAQPGHDYCGIPAPWRVRRLGHHELTRTFDDRLVAAAFETAEVAVDPVIVADHLTARVHDDPRIHVHTGVTVTAVSPRPDGVDLTLRLGDDLHRDRFDQVVNCAWCGRLALDASAGIRPPAAWSFRRKFFLRLPPGLAPTLPATTIVLGPFGDLLPYPDGSLFLSWYPVSCLGLECGLEPTSPEMPTAEEQQRMRAGIVQALGQLVPALHQVPPDHWDAARLAGGIIYALGSTDVDDRTSQLHERHAVGLLSRGRYHTIDTGKYTIAPLLARRAVAQMLPAREKAA